MCPKKATKTPQFSVFVSNLSQDVKFHRLESYLKSRFQDFKISKSKNRGKNRVSHAVLTLSCQSDFDRVLSEPFVVDGCSCAISSYIDDAERQRISESKMARRVYINNLAEDITKSELAEIFGQYGEYDELYLKENHDSRFETRYGFATFCAEASTWNCLCSSRIHFLGGSKVDFMSAEDFQTMLEIRRSLKKIKKIKAPKLTEEKDFPGQIKIEVAQTHKNFEKKITSDSSEGLSDHKAEILRAQETEELKIKYLARPGADRHGEYVINRLPSASHW